MNEKFVLDKGLMAQLISEIKALQLHRYEDYVRVVGVVSILENAMLAKAPDNTEPEEVVING